MGWIGVVGLWLIAAAALLQTVDSLGTSWAWLNVAQDVDPESYARATESKGWRKAHLRAIGGIGNGSRLLPWIPSSVGLERFNLRTAGWGLLLTGSFLAAMAGTGSRVIWCLFAVVTMVAVVATAAWNERLFASERKLARETFQAFSGPPDRDVT